MPHISMGKRGVSMTVIQNVCASAALRGLFSLPHLAEGCVSNITKTSKNAVISASSQIGYGQKSPRCNAFRSCKPSWDVCV